MKTFLELLILVLVLLLGAGVTAHFFGPATGQFTGGAISMATAVYICKLLGLTQK